MESTFFEGGMGARKFQAAFNFDTLTPAVQKHLQKVYSTLALSVFAAAVGAYLHFLLHVGGVITSIAFLACTMWLLSKPAIPGQEVSRVKLLMAAALFKGCSLGPLLELVANVDSGIIVTALVGTVAIFACFSGAALLSKRREFLFLGGLLSSAITLMLSMRLLSFFVGGSARLFQLELYGGLLLFVGYILFDTQLIVEKANLGDTDYVKHALDLFIDLVGVFVRILIILLKNGQQKESEEKRKRKNTSRR
eukprot:TRINITY_DN16591_c0_g1_i1.p1 TRINITY_DN16591_c0_g1~~TRINITY_DN16591_c0_g1_i1.p1  ORF type:complete len:251 (+),score=51.02 TRINITY_DN16591_c0_g1_i1:122-874(+)